MSEEPAAHGSTAIRVINYLSNANYSSLSEFVINRFAGVFVLFCLLYFFVHIKFSTKNRRTKSVLVFMISLAPNLV